ncbi:MAG: hypothetical protein Q9208_003860 [Pyrenodesmia sp. 3 TL-2023]
MTDMKLSLSLGELDQKPFADLERKRDERQEPTDKIKVARKAATSTAKGNCQTGETYMATREFEQKLRRANAGLSFASKTIAEARAARQPERAAEPSGQSRMSEGQRKWKSRYQQRKDADREAMKAADKVGNTDDAGMGNIGSDGPTALPQAPSQVSGPQHDTARSSGGQMPLAQAARHEVSTEASRVRERELEESIDKLQTQKAAGISGRKADNDRHEAEVKKFKACTQNLENTIDTLIVEKEEAINQRNSDNLQNEAEIKKLQASLNCLQEHSRTLTAEGISERIADNQQSQAMIDDLDTKIQKHMDAWNEAMDKRYAEDAERIAKSERDEGEIKKMQAFTQNLQRQMGQLSVEKNKAVQEREALKTKVWEQELTIHDLQSSLGNIGLQYDAQRLPLRATTRGPVTPPDFAAAGATPQPTTPPMCRHRSQSESSSGYHSAASRHTE